MLKERFIFMLIYLLYVNNANFYFIINHIFNGEINSSPQKENRQEENT